MYSFCVFPWRSCNGVEQWCGDTIIYLSPAAGAGAAAHTRGRRREGWSRGRNQGIGTHWCCSLHWRRGITTLVLHFTQHMLLWLQVFRYRLHQRKESRYKHQPSSALQTFHKETMQPSAQKWALGPTAKMRSFKAYRLAMTNSRGACHWKRRSIDTFSELCN